MNFTCGVMRAFIVEYFRADGHWVFVSMLALKSFDFPFHMFRDKIICKVYH